ncbi:Chitin-binding [Macleaya cordata]|nr:Chitin-binding [Macleaya cordata]
MSLLISTSTLPGSGGGDGGGVAQDVVLVCGAEGGGAPCPDGLCCSKWGHCAVNTSSYCNLENCQSQCDHDDDTLISTTTTTTGDALQSVPANRCGRLFQGALCSDDRCCSSSGWCGQSYSYCGGGCQSNCYDPVKYQCGWHAGRGVVKCRDNRCCSRWGFCGDTSEYCCDGCQSNCRCNKKNSTPLNGGDHNRTLIDLPLLLETA